MRQAALQALIRPAHVCRGRGLCCEYQRLLLPVCQQGQRTAQLSRVPPVTAPEQAYCLQSVNIIDPLTMTVVKNLTVDSNGAPLTNNGSTTGSVNASRSWNDAVYMEVCHMGAMLCCWPAWVCHSTDRYSPFCSRQR